MLYNEYHAIVTWLKIGNYLLYCSGEIRSARPYWLAQEDKAVFTLPVILNGVKNLLQAIPDRPYKGDGKRE